MIGSTTNRRFKAKPSWLRDSWDALDRARDEWARDDSWVGASKPANSKPEKKVEEKKPKIELGKRKIKM